MHELPLNFCFDCITILKGAFRNEPSFQLECDICHNKRFCQKFSLKFVSPEEWNEIKNK